MAARLLQRPWWQLGCCMLFAAVGNADITPTNSTVGVEFDGTISLLRQNNNDYTNITELLPLTPAATSKTVGGTSLFLMTGSSSNVTAGEIAFINCAEFPGYLQPLDEIFTSTSALPSAAIFFSTTDNYCNYTSNNADVQKFPVYSMTDKTVSQTINDTLSQPSQKYFARVQSTGNQDDPNQNPNTPPTPLGPSPSTAVAMIILYSITGVITALFLVIIVTGAVRAHRHPDRYGPRNVLGRPRQSRARGLGMAILDTIPIVKFGERTEPKPTDVELASASESRDVTAADTTATSATTEARTDAATETPSATTATQTENLDSGIAAAQPVAGAAVARANSVSEEGLGCSICTDDFEKGQDIRVLPCNHKFHPECVDPWLLNVSGTCPLCRVDLRPTSSHSAAQSSRSENADSLSPPLQSDADASHRRHSTLRDILSFRSRPNASADERISALRRLRESRREANSEVAMANTETHSDDAARDRRSRRMSHRLSDVFSGRRRGGGSPEAAEASHTLAPPARRDASPRSDGEGSPPETSNNPTSQS